MKRNILFLVLFILTSSCIRKRIRDDEVNNAKREVVKTQSVEAYFDLGEYYDNEDLYLDELPYDLIMSKKSNNVTSCYYFYHNYIRICNSGKFDKNVINKLDKPEQDFLIYMLNKGALKGDMSCQSYLYYYYKNGIVVKKNSLKADSLSKFFPEGYFDKVNL